MLAALHLAAALAPWLSGLPMPLKSAASAAALLGLAGLRRAWRDEAGACSLHVRDAGWTLAAGGREVPVEPLGDTVVWRHLVVLRLRSSAGVRSLVLLEDSCDADALRQLRVVLRMRGAVNSARPG